MKSQKDYKKHILLVDNDEQSVRHLTTLLEMNGFRVSSVSTGENALETISASVDLVLLSLVLPDQEGFEVCRQLKDSQLTRPIPVIILSERMCSEDVVEGLYLGADDYIVKPYDREIIIARIEAVLRRSSLFRSTKLIEQGEEAIQNELQSIIAEERIEPYFQPIYQFRPFKLLGVEVLSRPQTESMLANPEILFAAALKFGCYEEIEIMAWKKAVKYVSNYISKENLFLNCNPHFIENAKTDVLAKIFTDANLDINNIVLEITERSAVKDFKLFYKYLTKYREFGFKFAVDDVGGGYSSLESIIETRPEIVKIDRHIINGISSDTFKRSVVKFIVSFCKENAIFCIAEGIETKEDLDVIIQLGVDAGQGYYLYRPAPKVIMDDILAVSSKIR